MSQRLPISPELRLKIMKRDGYTCVYCGAYGANAELEIDHIVPHAKGGSNHPGNLTVSCRSCNSKKRIALWQPKKPFPIGLFLLTFDDNNECEYQGQIIDCENNMIMVQLYEWLFGGPGKLIPMDKTALYSNKVMLFENENAWKQEAYKWCM